MSEQITVRLPDGSTRALATGTTAAGLAKDIGSRLAKAAVIAVVNGEERDLSVELHDGDEVAVVTGGGSGIGRAFALAFAAEGMHVAVADVDIAGAETVRDEARAMGGKAIAAHCDVSKREEVDALVNRAVALGGRHAMPPQDHGFMYGWSFYDLDGHHWEVFWMDPAVVAQG